MNARARRLPAGLPLAAHKADSVAASIVELPPPRTVSLSLDQGSGVPATAVVAVGQRVAAGTLVARADDPCASSVHTPIAGIVRAIDTRDAAVVGGYGPCIVIDDDGSGAAVPAAGVPVDFETLDAERLLQRLREAGIAGLGGAGFPTATKLALARARGVGTLLLNAAECEPWICCDDALLRHAAADVVQGAQILSRALSAARTVIAVEDDKPAAIAALRTALESLPDTGISMVVLPALYPQGAERQLILAVTGIEVPADALPQDAGVLCQNVGTAAAVAHWARTGEPPLTRIVTVTGTGVARPCNVRAAIGTPLAQLVAAAGGYQGTPLRLIAGGNMTGLALPSDEVGLTKATNCVLVATRADLGGRLDAAEQPCIRCGDCASVCPAGLLPQQLLRAGGMEDTQALRDLGVFDCIDCGLCDYVCPSQIPLAHRFRIGRDRLRAADALAEKAGEARERYRQHERRRQESAAAEQRAFAAVRAQSRPVPTGPSSPDGGN
jgi:electron transport complex protein RnfC